MNRFKLLMRNLHHVMIALDQLVNTIISVFIGLCNGTHKGYADETISAYLWRKHNYWYVNVFRVIVDIIFSPFMEDKFTLSHCKTAYFHECERQHSPE